MTIFSILSKVLRCQSLAVVIGLPIARATATVLQPYRGYRIIVNAPFRERHPYNAQRIHLLQLKTLPIYVRPSPIRY